MLIFLEYAGRGRTAWWRYPIACVLALIIAIVLGVVLLVALTIAHAVPRDISREMLQPSHPVVFFAANGITFASTLAGFVAAIWLLHGKRFGDVVGRWSWRLFLGGAALWVGVQIVLLVIDVAIAPKGFRLGATGPTAAAAVTALVAVAVQTFAEEFVFRGYLTQALLLATRRPVAAAVLSGLLFGAAHISNGLPQAAFATTFGIATAYIAIHTGGIAFTYGLHLVNNLGNAFLVVSATDVFAGAPGLVVQNTPQLMWWDVATSAVAIASTAALVSHAWRPTNAVSPTRS